MKKTINDTMRQSKANDLAFFINDLVRWVKIAKNVPSIDKSEIWRAEQIIKDLRALANDMRRV